MLTKEEQRILSEKILLELGHICKLYKIDFFELSKDKRELLISVFQAGVGWRDLLK